MIKKRIFIGSSSEELALAENAKAVLEDQFDVTIWNDSVWDSAVFRVNQNFLADLLKASLKFDFGILLGTNDDKVIYRGAEALQPRDNVLFELGLFTGRLGTSKCAFIIENGLKVLTDLQGISLARFDKADPTSFTTAVNQIKELFLKAPDTEINFFPSATLAAVYFENLIVPTCKYLIQNKGFSHDGTHYYKVKLKIIIPDRISSDLNLSFEKIKSKFATTPVSFNYDGRPRSVTLDTSVVDNTLVFVDFPTIISGINFSIHNLLPNDFNQLSADYDLIVERELVRFIGTIKQFLLRDGFDDMVVIVRQSELN